MMEKKIPVYWTVIGGLILTAILVITTRLCSKPDVVQYIGFAGTITSLVLGVIAIFYSIVSNTQSSQNIGALTEASQKVMDGGNKISGISESIDNSVKALTEITSKLNQNLESLPGHLQGMKDELSNVTNVLNLSIQSQKVTKEEVSEDVIRIFFNHSSFAGLMVIYAVFQTSKKNIPLSLTDLSKYLYPPPYDSFYPPYFTGYLIAAASLNLVNGSIIFGDPLKYKADSINPTADRIIKEFIESSKSSDASHIESINKLEIFLQGQA